MLDLTSWIVIPVISAFIGYALSRTAVKMIFRPLKPIQILGFTVLGLIPRRKAEIAKKLSELIEENVISHWDIANILKSENVSYEAATFLSDQVDNFTVKIAQKNPMIGMFVRGDVLTQVKTTLSNQLSGVLPELIGKLSEQIGNNLDMKKIISEKIDAIDTARLEKIVYGIFGKELKAVQVFGGVLGFVIGIGQVVFMQLTR